MLLFHVKSKVTNVHLSRPHFDWQLIPFFKMESTQIVSLTAFNKKTSDGVEGVPMLALVVIQQVFYFMYQHFEILIALGKKCVIHIWSEICRE